MLKISQDQIDMFSQVQRNRFVVKVVAYIRSNSCNQIDNVSEKELIKDVNYLIDKAVSYGYKKQQDIFYFIEIVLMCGENFENNPKYSLLVSNLRRNNEKSPVPIKQLYYSIKLGR